jgi:hypothetical protein
MLVRDILIDVQVDTTWEAMKHYVYIYRDPETEEPFYIGKGSGNRAYIHLDCCRKGKSTHSDRLTRKIKAILDNGLKPVIEIANRFENSEDAFEEELRLINEHWDSGCLVNGTRNQWPIGDCREVKAWRDAMNSKEFSQKMKDQKSDYWARQRAAGKDLSLSEEHKKKLSIAGKGKLAGEKNPMAKNTKALVEEYLQAIANGEHWRAAAERLGVSNAYNAAKRYTWKSAKEPEGYREKWMPRKNNLTPAIEERILSLRQEGKSYRYISEDTGISVYVLTKVIKKSKAKKKK